MSKKSIVSQINTGNYLSRTSYYKVTNPKSLHGIEVANETGFSFQISSEIVENELYSAHQFSQEVKVTRTELIDIFTKCGDTLFTVNFNKQPTAKAINTAIASTNAGKIKPVKEMQKIINDAFDGEERTLVGYLLNVETGFGRSMVIDLEITLEPNEKGWDNRQRQVDHRTINWLIYKNVKYSVK